MANRSKNHEAAVAVKKDLEIQYLFIQVEFVFIDERLTNLRQAWFGKKWSKVDQKLEKRCFEEKNVVRSFDGVTN